VVIGGDCDFVMVAVVMRLQCPGGFGFRAQRPKLAAAVGQAAQSGPAVFEPVLTHGQAFARPTKHAVRTSTTWSTSGTTACAPSRRFPTVCSLLAVWPSCRLARAMAPPRDRFQPNQPCHSSFQHVLQRTAARVRPASDLCRPSFCACQASPPTLRSLQPSPNTRPHRAR